MTIDILYALSTGILGIFLGAQLCEAVLFVPQWKSLSPKDFFEMHKTHGKKIYQFFAPLTIVATIIPILTFVLSYLQANENWYFALFMALFTLLFFSTYFLYFKQANQSFADESLSHKELPDELDRWGKWHWVRVVFEFFAFAFSIMALM